MEQEDLFKKAQIAICNRNYEKAQTVLLPLAEDGNCNAQFLLGYLYFTSADVSYTESISWLTKAAGQEHPEACYYLSMDVGKPNCLNLEDRKIYLEKAAVLGCVEAQRDMGFVHATGQMGFVKDLNKSRDWYFKAAQHGDSDAQYNLGFMLVYGEGGEKDIFGGIHWLETAAKNSRERSIGAAKALYDIYTMGLCGVEKDYIKSLHWKGVCEAIKQSEHNDGRCNHNDNLLLPLR
jgi:TPR repeat protein